MDKIGMVGVNVTTVVEFSVDSLEVKKIIVCIE